jgi:hypothetical protein
LTSDEWFAGHSASLNLLNMESVYRKGAGGYTSRKRDFEPSDLSQPKVAAPEKVFSNQPSESEKRGSTELTTKGEASQSSSASEKKEELHNPIDSPRPQREPQSQPGPSETPLAKV